MLLARGRKQIGAGDLLWALSFAPRLWSVVVERHGLVLDTRFVPASIDPPSPRSCVYLLLEGTWTIHGAESEPRSGPVAFLVTEEQLEGASGSRPFTFAAASDPFRAIELHVHDSDLGVAAGALPLPMHLPPAVWDAASRVVRLSQHDDASFRDAFRALLEGLARERIIPHAVADGALRPSKPFSILWAALRPMIERLYLTPTLREVADISGMSTRQMDRYIQSFVTTFGLVGDRWRTTTLHLRLKLAVILLSAEGASVTDVAAAVGYGSSDAMARAFRDAGLRSPSAVQEELQRAHSPLARTIGCAGE